MSRVKNGWVVKDSITGQLVNSVVYTFKPDAIKESRDWKDVCRNCYIEGVKIQPPARHQCKIFCECKR